MSVPERVRAQELIRHFRLENLPPTPVRLSAEALAALRGAH